MSIVRSPEVANMEAASTYDQSDLENSLVHLLEKRWSPRAFSEEPLTAEEINGIFDSGRQVASSYNEQPWRFILTDRGSEAYTRLYSCLADLNQKWVDNAPHLGVVLAKEHFTHNDKENRHRFYDCGAFMAAASLRAAAKNIYVHQMAGFSTEKITEKFNFPDDFSPITMFVLGRLGDAEDLPEKLREKESPESDRNSVFTFLFSDKWGAPY